MPNDARLGLVVGVTVVILVAVLFVRKDSVDRNQGAPASTRAAVVQLPSLGSPVAPTISGVPNPGRPLFQRTHTVSDGETLVSIAVLYYNDASKVSFLYRSNSGRIMGPDRVPVGTVLVIPPLPQTEVASAQR